MSLAGRIDTLSAPEFYAIYDEVKENINKVVVDIKDLQYISSAGLRVFLKMSKALGKENVCVTNVNTLIQEIFDTTGFNQLVTIK